MGFWDPIITMPVDCDGCAEHTEIQLEDTIDVLSLNSQTIDELQNMDWKVDGDGDTILCPNCNPDYIETCECCGEPLEGHTPAKDKMPADTRPDATDFPAHDAADYGG